MSEETKKFVADVKSALGIAGDDKNLAVLLDVSKQSLSQFSLRPLSDSISNKINRALLLRVQELEQELGALRNAKK